MPPHDDGQVQGHVAFTLVREQPNEHGQVAFSVIRNQNNEPPNDAIDYSSIISQEYFMDVDGSPIQVRNVVDIVSPTWPQGQGPVYVSAFTSLTPEHSKVMLPPAGINNISLEAPHSSNYQHQHKYNHQKNHDQSKRNNNQSKKNYDQSKRKNVSGSQNNNGGRGAVRGQGDSIASNSK